MDVKSGVGSVFVRPVQRRANMLTLLSVSKSLIGSSLYHTAEVLLARDKTVSNLGCHFPSKLECMIRMHGKFSKG